MANKNPKVENIKPYMWEKGKSGNPGGRPKKIPEIQRLLASVMGDEQQGITAAERILKSILARALDGDVRAAELLLDRAYGKVKTNIELNDEGLIIRVVRDGDKTDIEETT